MAAVSVIHNPLNPEEVLLFYCSEYQQVHLERWIESSNMPDGGNNLTHDEPPPATKDSKLTEDKAGAIKHPSSFASITYKGILWVLGIRKDNTICVVSPAFASLKHAPLADSSYPGLAVCANEKNAWLYYVANGTAGCINEYRFDPGVSSEFTHKYAPTAGTTLCAYCIGSKRYCIYQDDKSLMIFNASSGSESKKIENASPKDKTPMAVCVANGNVYLYFCDSKNRLVRIVRRGEDWAPSALVTETDPLPLKEDSQITVTTTVDGKSRMVFYIIKGNNRYTRIIDETV